MGIEPTYPAWKAGVLPLNYTRMYNILLCQLIDRWYTITFILWCQHFFYNKCPVPESNQRHEDFQSSALPTELTGHWVAGVGFEPTTFGLWARRASGLLHPAILVSAFIQLSKMWRKIQTVLISQNYFLILTPNGRRRIRTTEAICSRFTVCPLWPLGNPSIRTI